MSDTTNWLAPVAMALKYHSAPVELFFRDDDVGPREDSVYRLLDLFAMHRVPIDLAVIPTTLDARLADDLVGLHNDDPRMLGLHQHGYRHTNYESTGRKCEFGPSRTAADQFNDLRAGQHALAHQLGAIIDPIFTPPWNRCTVATMTNLVSLGFRALSRDQSATPATHHSLQSLPVAIDWSRVAIGAHPAAAALAIAQSIRVGRRCGVMLHHAATTEEQFESLEQLIAFIAAHQRIGCRLMRDLLSPALSPSVTMQESP
jgi:hypothetical protein